MIARTLEFFGVASLMLASAVSVNTFNANCNDNYVNYWGQNSYGAAGGAQANWQKPLASYCQDSTEDILVLAFLDIFNPGGTPQVNFSNQCSPSSDFPATQLEHCSQIGADIKTCQAAGKKILLSLGGASGAYGFSSDAQGIAFADELWNLFGAGSSSTRPFDDAVVDGFDLDIEGGGSTGYAAMVNQLKSHFATDKSKTYYISGAPQCPYPDANMQSILNAVSFDFVFVQFYNNYCGATTSSFNFNTWDNWAKTLSPNPNVKIFLGLPGSTTAAGSGYVPYSQLTGIITSTRNAYSSFGGVMFWDASQTWANTDGGPTYAQAVSSFLKQGGSCSSGGGTTKTTSTTTTTSKTSTISSPTTTSSKATSTTTTTSSQPSSTGLPACNASTQGNYYCVAPGTSPNYQICNNGVYASGTCGSGTVCKTSGSSIVCDYL
ncbi:hypothetical protein BZG36_04819 [Bifiguratus adelaidae]|uniref:chitinase n=1 Tax=Bifiguratus adelaidae TaxID=1938954 RepID=A0A261XVM1_9FUNG|nr:hypothetical protein BZG36_04819 [Bifiguratus adelaidae]